MSQTLSVFISSKMKELATERQAIRDLLPTLGNELIQLSAWVYESDAPASDDTIRQIYLRALENSALYIGLFWNQYGEWTIDEFNRATEWGIPRHVYVKDVDAEQRDPRLTTFLNAQSGVTSGVAAKWFKTTDDLRVAIRESISEWLRGRLMGRRGALSAVLYQNSARVLGVPDQLIGRDDLIATIMPQIEQNQRILLHGFGGEGKTALAATLAQQRLEMNSGPVLWLQAGNSDAETLFEALVAPLNAQQAITGQTGDAKLMAVRQVIAAMDARLVVLDDVWNGQALAQVLRAMPPEAAVVITSRSRYPIPLQHSIGGLDVECAREVLSYYAGQDLNTAPEVNELIADLGYHAYALEIAAKTLLVDDLTPAELRARIAAAPHDLTMPEFFVESGRENIGALLEASLNALDSDTRAVFDAFGTFTSANLTTELLALYLDRVPDTDLTMLVRRGLAERLPATELEAATMRLHDLAYSYARASSTNADRERALDACLAYIERHNTPNLDNFSVLRPVLDALLGAAEVAVELGRDAEVAQVAWGLFSESKILDFGGFYIQTIPLLTQAAAAAVRQGDQGKQGRFLSCLGEVYSDMGQYDRAIEYHEQALAIARQVGDRNKEDNCLGRLGSAYAGLWQQDRAIEYFQQALAISREIGDRSSEGVTLGNLGNAYSNLGQYDRAIEYCEQALVIAREVGDRRNEGTWLNNMGNAYSNLGQYDQAIEYHEQALTIAQEIGGRRGEGIYLGNLGNAYSNLGQYDRANEYHKQALAIAQEIGDRHGEGICLGFLGNAYRNLGQYDRAIECHEQALIILREIGNQHDVGQQLGALGNAYSDLGQYDRAIEYHEQALAMARNIGDRRGEGVSLSHLGTAYAGLNQVDQAIEYYEQALAIAREMGNQRDEGLQLGNLGNAYISLNQAEKAIEYWEQGLNITQALGDRHNEGRYLSNLGDIYRQLVRYEQATEYTGRAIIIAREVGDQYLEAVSLGSLGMAYAHLRQLEQSVEHLEQARAIFMTLDKPHMIKWVDNYLIEIREELAGDNNSRDDCA